MTMKTKLALLAMAVLGSSANAALVDTRVDTTLAGAAVDAAISGSEYGAGAYSYTGGGTGFGGTVGNGTIYFDSDLTNLYLGFVPGSAVNDIVGILLDTKAGGFTDATMNDTGDGSRRVISDMAAFADDLFDPNFLPDYGITIGPSGSFGTVLFELAAGPLNFLAYDDGRSFPREYAIPLATLGVAPGGNVDFLVVYAADSGWGSNESIPAYAPLNSGGNPGHSPTSAGFGNYNRFTVVPEPSSVLAMSAGLVGMMGLIRRKR